MKEHVIIAGFGVAGRFVAECLQEHRVEFVVVEMNPETCRVQREAGMEMIEGDISDDRVMQRAGVETASVVALTIPDEAAALRATEKIRAIRPNIHLIASTQYTSTGLTALQKGADDVIVAEQAVAQEFYRRISTFMSNREPQDKTATVQRG